MLFSVPFSIRHTNADRASQLLSRHHSSWHLRNDSAKAGLGVNFNQATPAEKTTFMCFRVALFFYQILCFCSRRKQNKDKAVILKAHVFSCRSCARLPNAISGKSFIFKVMNPPQGMCDLCSLLKPL